MRLEPDIALVRISSNKSPRYGKVPKILVLHSTESRNVEGTSDLVGVASWLCNPAAKASAHVIVDSDGQSARIVQDEFAAWSCANYNAESLNIEQVGSASQTHWPVEELRETARWLALWSLRHDIPLRRGRVLLGKVVRKGVVTHAQLGAVGGGHTDPGSGYPVKRVIELAKQIRKELR